MGCGAFNGDLRGYEVVERYVIEQYRWESHVETRDLVDTIVEGVNIKAIEDRVLKTSAKAVEDRAVQEWSGCAACGRTPA